MIFFKTNKNKIIIIAITITLMLSMFVSSIGKEKAGIVSNTFGIILTPFQTAADYIMQAFSYGKDKSKFENENTILKQQLITAQKEKADYDDLASENAKLRAMLELKKNSGDLNLIAADVVATDSSSWSGVIKINKGASSGIKKNDTVITEAGLVGYVSKVGQTWAIVTTITDLSSSVSAVIERINEYCIVQGDISLYDKNLCAMKYASADSAVSTGDIVSTSGDGGIYPKGIQIGKITKITVNTNGISQDAHVEPFVDFSNLSAVMVMRSSIDRNELPSA